MVAARREITASSYIITRRVFQLPQILFLEKVFRDNRRDKRPYLKATTLGVIRRHLRYLLRTQLNPSHLGTIWRKETLPKSKLRAGFGKTKEPVPKVTAVTFFTLSMHLYLSQKVHQIMWRDLRIHLTKKYLRRLMIINQLFRLRNVSRITHLTAMKASLDGLQVPSKHQVTLLCRKSLFRLQMIRPCLKFPERTGGHLGILATHSMPFAFTGTIGEVVTKAKIVDISMAAVKPFP
jgi:hypothetical protein